MSLLVEGLAFAYPDGTEALRGVSLRAGSGECLGLVGPNGAGKTTLVQVVAGFLAPRAGAVTVDGLRLAPDTLAAVRARTGFLFVDPDDQLFMPTVLEDVCFGPLAAGVPPEVARAKALSLLWELGIGDLAPKFPVRDE